MTDYLIPILLVLVCAVALRKKENAYSLLLDGGMEGLKLIFGLLPTLVLLLTGIHMLRASGAMEVLCRFIAPWLPFIPPQTAMLVLIRPISGSAALAVGAELMAQYGPDSTIGRTVSVMLGSTETTFFVMSVYLSHAGIKKSRYILPAALLADLTGFVMAALTVRYL